MKLITKLLGFALAFSFISTAEAYHYSTSPAVGVYTAGQIIEAQVYQLTPNNNGTPGTIVFRMRKIGTTLNGGVAQVRTGSITGPVWQEWTYGSGLAYTNSPTYTLPTTLQASSINYYITVKNQTGIYSGKITVTELGILATPTLSSPSNGATGVSKTPSFNWNDIQYADRYRIFVATSSSTLSALADDAQTCSGCIINQLVYSSNYTPPSGVLSGSTKYYWMVHAGAIGAGSPNSSIWSFTTLADVTIPSTPNAPSATATGPTSINISWSSVSGATEYKLYRSTSASGTYTQIYYANGTSYTDSGTHLTPNTTYYYKVSAGNSAGWSGMSLYKAVTTQALAQITNVGPSSGNYELGNSMTVTWSYSASSSTPMILSIKRGICGASGCTKGDANWRELAVGTSNDGSQAVTIPTDINPATDWRVYVKNQNDENVWAAASGEIVLQQNQITSVNPSSGTYNLGSNMTVSWSYAASSSTPMILSIKRGICGASGCTKGDANWRELATGTSNDGSQPVPIPTDINPATDWRVYVKNQNNENVWAAASGEITLQQPNNLPTGSISQPSANSSAIGNITVSASASDADGLKKVSVVFVANGTPLVMCEDGTANPCSGTSGSWTKTNVDPSAYGASPGTVDLGLHVKDDLGLNTDTLAYHHNFTWLLNSAPTGTILMPAADSSGNGLIDVQVTATDPEGLYKVSVVFVPNGIPLVMCDDATATPMACPGTTGTFTVTGVDPAAYGANIGVNDLGLHVKDDLGGYAVPDHHLYTWGPAQITNVQPTSGSYAVGSKMFVMWSYNAPSTKFMKISIKRDYCTQTGTDVCKSDGTDPNWKVLEDSTLNDKIEQVDIPTDAYPQSDWRVYVKDLDNPDVVTAAEGHITITRPNSLPAGEIIAPTEGSYHFGMVPLHVKASDVDGLKRVSVAFKSTNYKVCDDDTANPCPAGTTGEWTIEVDPSTLGMTDGEIPLGLHVQDDYEGNLGGETLTDAVNIYWYSTPPAITGIQPSSGTYVRGGPITVTWVYNVSASTPMIMSIKRDSCIVDGQETCTKGDKNWRVLPMTSKDNDGMEASSIPSDINPASDWRVYVKDESYIANVGAATGPITINLEEHDPATAGLKCIGHDYEQQMPLAGVILPSITSLNVPTTMDEGELGSVSVQATVDVNKGASAFYYWCSDKGTFEKDPAYPEYNVVKFRAPMVAGADDQAKITVQVGDALGYIAIKSALVNVREIGNSNTDDPVPVASITRPGTLETDASYKITFSVSDKDQYDDDTTHLLLTNLYYIKDGQQKLIASGLRGAVKSYLWVPSEACSGCSLKLTTTDGNSVTTVTSGTFAVNQSYIIEGYVSDLSSFPIESAAVNISGKGIVYTDYAGYYRVTGLAPGTYTVFAEKEGYYFQPTQANVQLSTAEPHSRVNFNDAMGIDSDGDGLTNSEELAAGTSPDNPDTDGDGVLDGADLYPLDPNESADSDGDGIGDNHDACPADANHDAIGDPCNHDEDSDGVLDVDDACPNDPNDAVGNPCNHDEDADGVLDTADACPNDPNDAVGDPCNHDEDGDTVPDAIDPCPTDTNDAIGNPCVHNDCTDMSLFDPVGDPCNHDEDGDGALDSADACPTDPNDSVGDPCNHDEDKDGILDVADACPFDAVHDLVGNPCDHDEDDDGVADNADVFPFDSKDWSDIDGDGIGDNSDPDTWYEGFESGDLEKWYSVGGTYAILEEAAHSQKVGYKTVGGGCGKILYRTLDIPASSIDLKFWVNTKEFVRFALYTLGGDWENAIFEAVTSLIVTPTTVKLESTEIPYQVKTNEWVLFELKVDVISNTVQFFENNQQVLSTYIIAPQPVTGFKFIFDQWSTVYVDDITALLGIDSDQDGIDNRADTDDDNDGVLDTEDAFPLNPAESVDTDGDGIGNNADTDDDNDGVLDVNDKYPLDPTKWDDSGLDSDGDGVLDAQDAFPQDPTESVDTDSDGIGNNADPDDDNDGVFDGQDLYPLDPTKWNDGTNPPDPNVTDTDGDGVVDALDAFPLDPLESVDTDNDGIGNNADADDDNDGVLDVNDKYPLDPTKWDDGTTPPDPEVTDPLDIDGDGVVNSEDAFPNDPAESVDTDVDGIGNNADTDDDGDSISDTKETSVGLDPLNPDSDNDGVADGDEKKPFADSDGDGLINALDTDSDNDGIPDGVETGATKPVKGPKKSVQKVDETSSEIPLDQDPTTTTDPTNPDTDNGGLSDGQEDLNHNGLKDAGERDPLDNSDDSSPEFVTGGKGGCALAKEAKPGALIAMIGFLAIIARAWIGRKPGTN